MHTESTHWQRWVHQPQHLWFRKAFFQIHLWIGISIGLYIVAISLSGAAVVYARELTTHYARKPVILNAMGPPLSYEQLSQYAERAYPGYHVVDIAFGRRPVSPAMVALSKSEKGDGPRIERLIDQYSGAALGDPLTPGVKVVQWMVDFHDNLLSGETGRLLNGVGSILVTLISITGAVLWWPGKKDWKRSMRISWKSGLPRLNWDLHSFMGLWFFIAIFLWGISGIYFSFPGPFNSAAEYLLAAAPHSRQVGTGEQILYWLSKLHFGRFGWQFEALWVVLGLIPPAMLVTGVIMWWNRSLSKITVSRRRTQALRPASQPVEADLPAALPIPEPLAPAPTPEIGSAAD